MQMTNEEKKELLNRVRDLITASCNLQKNIDMLHSMENISQKMLGFSFTEEEKYAIQLKYSQRNSMFLNRLLDFLEIDFENDPFWKEEERKVKENAENMMNTAGRVVCPLD